jgi:coenzyme F420-reducing hydrogenase delta subunit
MSEPGAEMREPEITVLTCAYCGNVPVELAGLQRIAYPAAVRVLPVPCTGSVGIGDLLKALEQGADGVLLVACPEGNCHHLNGNLRAARRLKQARVLLQQAGLAPERLALEHLGVGQAQAFADAVSAMAERIRKCGPSGKEAV